ncbi:MAG: type II toxin-antitoxin system HipA family toxin [Epsilonproteobacteria bacterium]|nr:type II toxin-antitoxin system HipA family toxin [Campylobacterota bacterium]
MSTKLVNVFYHKKNSKLKVGRLALDNRKIYFEYDKDFLQSGIELSPYKLPLKEGVFSDSDHLFDGLFGLFADSLPDGWGRFLLDRYLMNQGYQLSQISPLDRLMLVGKYGIGALSYEPIIESLDDTCEIDLDDLATSSLEILRGNDEKNIEALLQNNGSSGGARPKIMIQINENNHFLSANQPLKKGYEHYMVKFSSSNDHQEMGKLEFLYSQMAKDSGIEITDTKLLLGEKNSYFAIKRFDRIRDERVHIHSLAGLVHTDFRIPSVDYDDILTVTLHLTKDINEVIKVYRLAVFNLFTHNRDDHAKNFSFLLDDKNSWKFAPAYDLTFSYGPGGEHSTTYLNEGKNPTIKHLEQLGQKHRIREYKKIIEEIKYIVSQFKKYAKNVELSPKYTEEIFRHFCFGCKNL